jgi:hypothetical protein
MAVFQLICLVPAIEQIAKPSDMTKKLGFVTLWAGINRP